MRGGNQLFVMLRPHALDRWREYVGWGQNKQVTAEVKRHLWSALKTGMKIDHTGAAQLKIRSGLYAVVRPELTGGWAIVTFHQGTFKNEKDIN